ncbi:MAG: hypothetical protein K2W96_17375 [Gemmataceae bacterium]|nr:hypothetical protein [Gemmataceae bacterium]
MDPLDLIQVIEAAAAATGVPYAICGSMASTAFGEPRLTNDVDILAAIRPDQVAAFCARFPDGDWYVSLAAAKQAVAQRFQFNIIHPASGLKIDVIIPADSEFDREQMSRRLRVATGSGDAWFTTPEDVILKKLEYHRLGGSDKHLRDIAGILKVRGEKLDRAYIGSWAARLGVARIWEKVQEREKEAGTPG